MGYDVYVTRADPWWENDDRQICSEEWLDVVERDPQLVLYPANGPCFAIWSGTSELDDPWLDWRDGMVYTKNPDQALIDKMVEIAAILQANVLGDDGEQYPNHCPADTSVDSRCAAAAWGWRAPHWPLILAIVSFASMLISVALDVRFRPGGQIAAEAPPGFLPVIAILGLGSMFGCIFSIILAVRTLASKGPGGGYAIAALLVCAAAIVWLATENV